MVDWTFLLNGCWRNSTLKWQINKMSIKVNSKLLHVLCVHFVFVVVFNDLLFEEDPECSFSDFIELLPLLLIFSFSPPDPAPWFKQIKMEHLHHTTQPGGGGVEVLWKLGFKLPSSGGHFNPVLKVWSAVCVGGWLPAAGGGARRLKNTYPLDFCHNSVPGRRS